MADVLIADSTAGVLQLTLNRPEQKNALNSELVAAIAGALANADRDPDVKVIVLRGAGDAFCAGADLKEVEVAARDSATFRTWLRGWTDTFRAAETSSKPVIAAVHGLAIAGGLELALSADFIVASDRARFCDAHIRHGLVPGGGGTQRLPAAIGTRWARWMMYTGVTLDAGQAMAIGLVQHVVTADQFDSEIARLAGTMATRSGVALSFMKRMTTSKLVSTDLLEMEAEVAAHLVAGPDAREGLLAFKEKREPAFTSNLSNWKY